LKFGLTSRVAFPPADSKAVSASGSKSWPDKKLRRGYVDMIEHNGESRQIAVLKYYRDILYTMKSYVNVATPEANWYATGKINPVTRHRRFALVPDSRGVYLKRSIAQWLCLQ
jgi:hypothetical protein